MLNYYNKVAYITFSFHVYIYACVHILIFYLILRYIYTKILIFKCIYMCIDIKYLRYSHEENIDKLILKMGKRHKHSVSLPTEYENIYSRVKFKNLCKMKH